MSDDVAVDSARDAVGPRVQPHILTNPSPDETYTLTASIEGVNDAIWAALPDITLKMATTQTPQPSRARRPAEWIDHLAHATIPSRGPSLTQVGSVLFASTGTQTDRVLRPIWEALGKVVRQPRSVLLPGLSPRRVAAASMVASRSVRELRSWCMRAGLPEPPELASEVYKAEIYRLRAESLALTGNGVTTLVVATQHNSITRSITRALASNGISTCYVPHAPVANNPWYRDLPVHYALLRGPAEVDFYSNLGAISSGRLLVVGQPGTERAATPRADTADHIVYAASPRPPERLMSDVAVIQHAVDRPVEVCLHPRSDPSTCDLFPPGWTVHPPGSAMRVIRKRGAHALIQHSSGVGLEAMKAGLDVIDLCPAGHLPNYPYIAPPHVQIVHNSRELRSALDAVSHRKENAADRASYADQWTTMWDSDATAAAIAALLRISATPTASTLLLDSWPMRRQPNNG